jgi:hypothetical protein
MLQLGHRRIEMSQRKLAVIYFRLFISDLITCAAKPTSVECRGRPRASPPLPELGVVEDICDISSKHHANL